MQFLLSVFVSTNGAKNAHRHDRIIYHTTLFFILHVHFYLALAASQAHARVFAEILFELNVKMGCTLFWSHAWALDALGRNNHSRVLKLSEAMRKMGYISWIDEQRMNGDIDACMANGISNADAIIICISEAYSAKLQHSATSLTADNCYKEWIYALKSNKMVIPVVMEPSMLDQQKWAAVLLMNIGNRLYVDASSSCPMTMQSNLTRILKMHNIHPVLSLGPKQMSDVSHDSGAPGAQRRIKSAGPRLNWL